MKRTLNELESNVQRTLLDDELSMRVVLQRHADWCGIATNLEFHESVNVPRDNVNIINAIMKYEADISIFITSTHSK